MWRILTHLQSVYFSCCHGHQSLTSLWRATIFKMWLFILLFCPLPGFTKAPSPQTLFAVCKVIIAIKNCSHNFVHWNEKNPISHLALGVWFGASYLPSWLVVGISNLRTGSRWWLWVFKRPLLRLALSKTSTFLLLRSSSRWYLLSISGVISTLRLQSEAALNFQSLPMSWYVSSLLI